MHSQHRIASSFLVSLGLLSAAGCAATSPVYSVRPTPVPNESQEAVQIEREISRIQGQEFEKQGAREIRSGEKIKGFPVQQVVDRLARTTERAYLPYRTYIYTDKDPNAAALADGRIYISSGMFDYLAGRGGREDELAFILGHELAHTVAQHLVQRYEQIQRQQMIAAAIAAGASAITRNASTTAQQLGRAAVSVTGLLQQVALSGYSQQQELEADQLGIRYVMRAGNDPHAALEMLKDFAKFDSPSAPMLRTHPYIDVRREYLERYLAELDQAQGAPFSRPRTVPANVTPTPAGAMPPANLTERSSRPQPEQFRGATVEKIKDLQDAQKLYPKNSVSWKNLQQEIDRLQRRQ